MEEITWKHHFITYFIKRLVKSPRNLTSGVGTTVTKLCSFLCVLCCALCFLLLYFDFGFKIPNAFLVSRSF